MRLSDTLPHPPNFHWVSGMCSCWTTTYICFSWTRQQSLGPSAREGAVWVEFPKFSCLQIQWAARAGVPALPMEGDELPKDRYHTLQSTFCLFPCLKRGLKEPAGDRYLIFNKTRVRGMNLNLCLVSTQSRIDCKQFSNSSLLWVATLFLLFNYLMRKYWSCNACVL